MNPWFPIATGVAITLGLWAAFFAGLYVLALLPPLPIEPEDY